MPVRFFITLRKLLEEARNVRQSFSNESSKDEDVAAVFNYLKAPINYTKFMVTFKFSDQKYRTIFIHRVLQYMGGEDK